MSNTEAGVRFERDTDGYGISCRVGGNTYSRYFLGTTAGERAKPFRLEERSAEDWANLRAEAAKAPFLLPWQRGSRHSWLMPQLLPV